MSSIHTPTIESLPRSPISTETLTGTATVHGSSVHKHEPQDQTFATLRAAIFIQWQTTLASCPSIDFGTAFEVTYDPLESIQTVAIGSKFAVKWKPHFDPQWRTECVFKTIKQEIRDQNPQLALSGLREILVELRILGHTGLHGHGSLALLENLHFEADVESGKIWPALIMKNANLGTLAEFQRSSKGIPYELKKAILFDVATGLQALHESRVVHGDVKAENVLISMLDPQVYGDDTYIARVCDFGCSIILEDLEPGITALRLPGRTFPWNAPESEEQIPISQLMATDIYSFGMLTWRCITDGNLAIGSFEAFKDGDCIKGLKLSGKMLEVAKQGQRIGNAHYSPTKEISRLYQYTLDLNPKNRTIQGAIDALGKPKRSLPSAFDPNPTFPRFPVPKLASPPRLKTALEWTKFIPAFVRGSLEKDIISLPHSPSYYVFDLFLHNLSKFDSFNKASIEQMFESLYVTIHNESLDPKYLTIARSLFVLLHRVLKRSVPEPEVGQLPSWSLLSILSGCDFFHPDDARSLWENIKWNSLILPAQRYLQDSADPRTLCQASFVSELKGLWRYLGLFSHTQDSFGSLEFQSNRPTFLHRLAQDPSIHWSPVQIACISEELDKFSDRNNHDEFIQYLNRRDHEGDTALLLACSTGNVAFVQLLLDRGADPSIPNNLGENGLHWLVSFQDGVLSNNTAIELAKKLRKAGKVNALAHARETNMSVADELLGFVSGTPLHRAIAKKRLDVCQLLVKLCFVDIDKKSGKAPFYNPMELAAALHLHEILGYLWKEKGAKSIPDPKLLDVAISRSTPLLRFCVNQQEHHSDLERTIATLVMKFQVPIVWPSASGNITALSVAIEAEYPEAVICLLRDNSRRLIDTPSALQLKYIKEDENLPDFTPLQRAMMRKNYTIFSMLLDNGADVNERSLITQFSCLHVAAVHGDEDLIYTRELIRKGAKVDVLDRHDITPFYYAARRKDFSLASYLLSSGAEKDRLIGRNSYAPWRRGVTALGRLILTEDCISIPVLEYLLEQQGPSLPASFIVRPKDGLTALHCAASRSGIDNQTPIKRTVLMYLCQKFSSFQQLNARIHDYQMTALHIASVAANSTAVEILLRCGSPVNVISSIGETALDLAVDEIQEDTYRASSTHHGVIWQEKVMASTAVKMAKVEDDRLSVVKMLLLRGGVLGHLKHCEFLLEGLLDSLNRYSFGIKLQLLLYQSTGEPDEKGGRAFSGALHEHLEAIQQFESQQANADSFTDIACQLYLFQVRLNDTLVNHYNVTLFPANKTLRFESDDDFRTNMKGVLRDILEESEWKLDPKTQKFSQMFTRLDRPGQIKDFLLLKDDLAINTSLRVLVQTREEARRQDWHRLHLARNNNYDKFDTRILDIYDFEVRSMRSCGMRPEKLVSPKAHRIVNIPGLFHGRFVAHERTNILQLEEFCSLIPKPSNLLHFPYLPMDSAMAAARSKYDRMVRIGTDGFVLSKYGNDSIVAEKGELGLDFLIKYEHLDVPRFLSRLKVDRFSIDNQSDDENDSSIPRDDNITSLLQSLGCDEDSLQTLSWMAHYGFLKFGVADGSSSSRN